jgi:hypothetical protein
MMFPVIIPQMKQTISLAQVTLSTFAFFPARIILWYLWRILMVSLSSYILTCKSS